MIIMKQIYTPNDYSHLESDSKMIQAAVDEAAKVGADYVHIKSIEKTNKDFFFDIVYSDGYTIMGEMYRLQF